MPYIVITGNDRKQCETIREALEYRTPDSRVYEMDAFGNLSPLGDDSLNELLKREPISKPVKADAPQDQAPGLPSGEQPDNKQINVTVNLQQPQKELVNFKELDQKSMLLRNQQQMPARESGFATVFKYAVMLIIFGTLIVVAIVVLAPFFKDLSKIMDMSWAK
jgi:hypothetical protein